MKTPATVSGPTPTTREFGLITVVQDRADPRAVDRGATDAHWRDGAMWEAVCGSAATIYQDCDDATAARSKAVTHDIGWYGARPFSVYARVDCSMFDPDDRDGAAHVTAALDRSEQIALEAAFWTGVAGGTAGRVQPHLAANAVVLDTENSGSVPVTLQLAATQVTGVALDIAEALGRLEHAATGCGNVQRTIHMTSVVAEIALSRGLLEARNGQMRTKLGSLVAVGLGYSGSSPAGTSTAGVHWMYATGPIFMYRSAQARLATVLSEALDRNTDTVIAISERTYVLGYDCCLYAIPVSLGGEISGSFNSAT
jgi:hypothetical protein